MKQLLFLLLFPCLCVAQYTGNAGQKITLGEQTSADGLVWRGRLADTANLLTNKLDTSVYIVLDTGTRAMWYYRASTTPKWTRLVDSLNNLQGQLSLTTKVTGVLPVANGGTGNTSLDAADIVTKSGTQTIGGAKTFTSAVTATRFNPTANTATGKGMFAPTGSDIGFSTSGLERIRINSSGYVGIGTTNPIGILAIKQVGAELTLQTDVNNLYFEAINRDSIDTPVNYRFYARYGSHIFYTGAYTERARIINNGTFLIGYTTDQSTGQLQVNGNVSAGGVILTSDQRFKENITPLTKGLEIINKLKPVTFNFVNDTENNFSKFEEVGFIAQDVDRALSTESFSKSIVKNADDSDIDSKMVMSVYNLIPILTKAIQEQQALIKALEQRILILENK